MNVRTWKHAAWLLTLLALVFAAGACSSGDNGGGGGGGGVSVNGLWSGVLVHSYWCEAGPSTFQIDIQDTAFTVSGGDEAAFAIGLTGTLSAQSSQSYAFALDLGGDVGIAAGRFYVDPTAEHGLLVLYQGAGADSGYTGVLQRGALAEVTYVENDLVGTWSGVSARVDADMAVTSVSNCSATVSSPDGLAISGSDGDGLFSGGAGSIYLEPGYETVGIYQTQPEANQIVWADESSYDALIALSSDKATLAVGFLTTTCNGTPPFSILPGQKFGIWRRQ